MIKEYSKEVGKNAIILIHDQLESFKYIGGFVQDTIDPILNFESGEGVPISIVTLPDFVLDFHQDNLGSSSQVCSVGGHAGHVTVTLLHLLSDEDATHRVHFITRTGSLGKMLLEDEFQKGSPENSYDTYKRYCEPFVMIRSGQPRCAYITGKNVGPGDPVEEDEINAEKHLEQQPYILEEIRNANSVYLGSFKTPDCDELLKLLLKTIKTGFLFLDTKRADDKSCQKLDSMFSILKFHADSGVSANEPEIIVFIRDKEYELVLGRASAVLGIAPCPDQIARMLHIRLICYHKSSIDLYSDFDNEPSGPILSVSQDVGVRVNSAARFCAGVILANAVHRTLKLLVKCEGLRNNRIITKHWGEKLRESFESRWSAIGGHWVGAAAYGVALALSNLDDKNLNQIADEFIEDYEAVSIRMDDNIGRTKRISLDVNSVSSFVQLAARRRRRKLKDNLLAQCKPVQRGHICIINERKVAVMFDLDGTLMDSTRQRGRALNKGLAQLHTYSGLLEQTFLDKHNTPNARLSFFEENIYALHQFFKWLGFGDFRQQWNLYGWYAVYIIFANKEIVKDKIKQAANDWEIINSDESIPVAEKSKMEDELKKNDDIVSFCREYESVLRNRAMEIGDARREFSEVQLHPLKEVRDLLTSLKESNAFNLYVVSEGEPETQWNKLCSIGLEGFFGQSHVLTTGDVAPEYDNERRQFYREKGELQRRLEDTEREYRYAHKEGIDLTEIELDIYDFLCDDTDDDKIASQTLSIRNKHRKKQLKNERRLKKKISQIQEELKVAACVEKILFRLRDKLSLAFYAAVIRAIMRNPNRPLDTLHDLQKIRHEEVGTPRMKLVMIGDRQTKDLHPPLELLADVKTQEREGLITIRLLSGKYAVTDDENPDTPDHPYSPNFLSLTMAQTKAILLSPNTWEDIRCLEQEPPLFNWSVNLDSRTKIPGNPEDNTESIGIDYILTGMSLSNVEFPVISNICSSLLNEHVNRCARKDIDKILTILFKINGDLCAKEIRAARLASFTLAGTLASERMGSEEEILFATELAKSRKIGDTAWIKEHVLNALHWIKDHAKSEKAKSIAGQAVT